MTRRNLAILAAGVGLALLLLLVLARKARGQAVQAAGGPPRNVGSYDRLPSLQAEAATRQRAVDIATRILAEDPPAAANIRAAMQATLDANRPALDKLQAAIDEIRAAGQA